MLVISHFVPSPVGDGGNHRAYQIVHDLDQVVGTGNVVVLALPSWREAPPPRNRLKVLAPKAPGGMRCDAVELGRH